MNLQVALHANSDIDSAVPVYHEPSLLDARSYEGVQAIRVQAGPWIGCVRVGLVEHLAAVWA